jgi:hypothetical protein
MIRCNMSINYLDSDRVMGVCYYLEDRDVKAVGSTSQRMQLIAKNELEVRDTKLEQLLSSYTISRQFNVQTLREADLFLMGEIHDNLQCTSDQSAFINFLARRGPVLLILEGYSSMEVLNDGDKSWMFEVESLNPTFRDNIYAIGWDNQKKVNKIMAAIKKRYNELDEELDMDRSYVIKKAAELLPKEMLPSVEELSELSTQVSSNQEFFSAFMNKIVTIDSTYKQRLFPSTLTNLARVTEWYEEVLKSHYILQIQKMEQEQSATEQTFPIRTTAMNNTLMKIASFLLNLGLKHAKIVLIAGYSHLEVEDASKVAFDLTSFYKQLNNHKAAILLPLEIKSAADAVREEKIKAIQIS